MKLKILHIFRDIYQNGGVPYEVRSLINSEIRNGYEVVIITDSTKVKQNFDINDNAKVILLNKNIFKNYRIINELLAKFKPAYAHLYSGWIPFNIFIWLILLLKKVPYIVSLHGILVPSIYKKRFGRKFNYPGFRLIKLIYHYLFDRNILKYSVAIHCLSKYEINLCKDILPKAKTILTPNGVEVLHNFDINYRAKSNNNVVKFVYLGRLDIFQKGLDLLLYAVYNLNQKSYSHKYIIDFIGPDINKSVKILNKNINKFKLENNIRIMEPIKNDELDKVLKKYDYLILVSRFEGLARVVREAVSRGLPVIATKTSNFGDWVSDYEMGFCINELTSETITDALEKAIDLNDNSYSKLRENTYKWAHEFTWDNVAKLFNSEMEKLLNE